MFFRKILTVVVALFYCTGAYAQNEKGTLEHLIARYEQNREINLSYDPELIKLIGTEITYTDDLDAFFSYLSTHFPLEVTRVSEGYFLITAREREYTISAIDSLDQSAIIPTDLMVLVNGSPIPLDYSGEDIKFRYKPALSDSVTLFALGYDQVAIAKKDLMNRRALSYSLMNIAVELEGVMIQEYLTKGIDMETTEQAVKIAVEDLPLLPGETDGDIFASIAALPGVTAPDQRAGNLFIRGSYTDQSLILFDGIPIYHRGHYYGNISPYNPKVVSNVQVYRSGFHPRLGGRVGGAIVIESGEEVQDQSHVGLGANTLYATAYGKASLADGKLGIAVGARRSYPTSFSSPKLDAISESSFSGTGAVDSSGRFKGDIDVLFQDYHTKVNYALNDKNRLALAAIYTSNDVVYQEIGQITNPAKDENEFKNQGYNLRWTRKLQGNWTSQSSLTYSDYKFKYTTDIHADGDTVYVSQNTLKDLNLRQEISRAGRQFNLDAGVDYKFQQVGLYYRNFVEQINGIYEVDEEVDAYTLSPYFSIDIKSWDRWDIELGLRGTYYSELEAFDWDPRFFWHYRVTDWLNFRGSLGWYHQYLSQAKNLEFTGGGFDNELWVLADSDNAGVITSSQASIGALIHDHGWILDIEGYHKDIDGVSLSTERRLRPNLAYHGLSQRISGIDVMLKKQISSSWDAWASYSYSQSEISIDTASDRSYVAKYVQPHVFYLGTSFHLERFKLSASYKWSTGLYEYSLDIIDAHRIYRAGRPKTPPPPGTPRPENPFSEVERDYYDAVKTLDISASYSIPPSAQHRWKATFGLSLVNIFDTQNLIDRLYRGDPSPTFVERYGIGFAPNLMVLVEW